MRPRPTGYGQPVVAQVGDGDVHASEGSCDLGRKQSDRAGSGDQHTVAGGDRGSAGRPHSDRHRLGHGGLLVAEAGRDEVGEVGVDGYELADRTVDRGRREEHDIGAQVVAPGQALAAGSARHTRFQRDPLTDTSVMDCFTGGDDGPGRLVPDDHGLVDHVGADPAMLVVVDVGAADADRVDLDQHLTGTGRRHRSIEYVEVSGRAEYGASILHGRPRRLSWLR